MDIIIKELLSNIYQTSNKIINQIDNDNIENINIFKKLTLIPKEKVFIYIIILIIVYIIFKKIIVSLSLIFGLFIGVIIIYFLILKDHNAEIKFIKNKDLQLKYLHTLMFDSNNWYYSNSMENFLIRPKVIKSYLYLNPLIVNFYYDMKGLSQISIKNFVTSLIHSNNIIGILKNSDIGLINPFQNLSVAKMQYKLAMNYYESIIHSLSQINSKSLQGKKYVNSINILQSILLDMIKKISNNCIKYNKKYGMTNISSPDNIVNKFFVIQSDDTKTMDYMPSFNYY